MATAASPRPSIRFLSVKASCGVILQCWHGSSAYRGEVGPDWPKGNSKKELGIVTITGLDLKKVLMVVAKHQQTRFISR